MNNTYTPFAASELIARYWLRHCMIYRLSSHEDELRVPIHVLADVCVENNYDFGTATLLMYGYGLEGWDED